MKNRADYPVLSLDLFPPRGEILNEVVMALHRNGADGIYLLPGRRFCWGFDESMRDEFAYPDELFSGLVTAVRRRSLTLVPVLSLFELQDFFNRHPTTANSVFTVEQGPQGRVLTSIIESMVQDLISVFPDAGRAGLQVVPVTAPVDSVDWWDLFCLAAEELSVEPVSIDATGSQAGISVSEEVWDLPAPPAWLACLSGRAAQRAEHFLGSYRQLDSLLRLIWLTIRRLWQGDDDRYIRQGEELSSLIDQLQMVMESCEESGRALFIPPWFSRRIACWRRGVLSALLHLQAGSRQPDAALINSIIAAFPPID